MTVILDAPVDIQLLYVLCALSVILIWMSHVVAIRQYKIPTGAISFVLMLSVAYAFHHIQILGLFWIMIMLVAGIMYQRQYYRYVMVVVMLVLGFLLAIHALPGFNNPVLLDNVQISQLSAPYSMYLNIDKFSAGIIVFWSVFSVQERTRLDRTAFIRAIPIAIMTIVVSMVVASFGLIVIDYKLSPYLVMFAISNLLFTCMTEESYFRGLIQKQLNTRVHYIFAILISGLLFGLAHYGAGRVDYVIAAMVAGIGYAYVYQRTNSIGASMMTHWALNMVHFVFFTYPFVRNAPLT